MVNIMTQNTKKQSLDKAKVKDIISKIDFSQLLEIPKSAILKNVKSSYKYDDDNKRTAKIAKQVITAMGGTTIDDAYQLDFDYLPKNGNFISEEQIEQLLGARVSIKDSHVSLIANMSKSRSFAGYSATGFKLIVTELAPFVPAEQQK